MDDASDPIDATLAGVGPRLRAARMARRLTLAEVSARTGVSPSTLSRLESGGRRPTLELLLPLARAYAVPLDELVGAPESGDPRVHIRPRRHRGGVALPLSRGADGIQVFKLVLTAAAARETPRQRTHPGREWVYVISGRLRLLLGEREYLLSPGEAAEFDTTLPHWLGPAEPVAVEFLSLFGPEGQRVHLAGSGEERD